MAEAMLKQALREVMGNMKIYADLSRSVQGAVILRLSRRGSHEELGLDVSHQACRSFR